MTMILPAKSILALDDFELSEHGRGPLQMTPNEIGTSNRTVNGTLRAWVVRRPWTIDTSWDNLPSRSPLTVDGYMGGMEMQEFYSDGPLTFKVGIFTDQQADRDRYAPTYEFTGRFTSFNYSITKRNIGGTYSDYWNVSLTIEEV